MAKKKKQNKKAGRQSLLIYQRLGQRMRTLPLLVVFASFALLAIGWLGSAGVFTGGNLPLIEKVWSGQRYIYVLIVLCVGIYFFSIIISRNSYVHPRPKALHIQAGIFSLDISYKRIKSLHTVDLKSQHNLDKFRGSDWAIIAPFEGMVYTRLDMASWPRPGERTLRRLWHKFMFSEKGDGLLLIVEKPMILNQQIDACKTARYSRLSKQAQGYVDPIERAFQAEKKSRDRR